jgi:hypothetical protein
MQVTPNNNSISHNKLRFPLAIAREEAPMGALKVIGATVHILRVLFGVLFGVLMEYSIQ